MTTEARLDPDEARRIYDATRRWGRWGPDDERGALNLLTAERTARALAVPRTHTTVSCAHPLPVTPGPENPRPAQHHMLVGGDIVVGHRAHGLVASHDYVGVACHGAAVTHVDALCHVFVDGRMYNDRPAAEVTSRGAGANAVDQMAGGVVARGVLLDIPRLRGVPWLEPGEAISVDDLEAACVAQGVTPEPGDALLVSTGRDARRRERGPWDPDEEGLAGLHGTCVPWLADHDPAVLGSDGISDVLPADPQPWPIPVHMCLLAGMGVPLLDNLRLDDLAAACAAAGRWEFLFTFAPLVVAGGTGSPINPIAVL